MLAMLTGASVLLAVACDENSDDDDSMATGACDEDERAEIFSADMERTGDEDLAIFMLNSISPEPSYIGDNDWLITVRSAADDSPLSGCSLTIRPCMPDHEHGSTQPSGAEGDPGVYLVGSVRFIMPGYWESTVTITCSVGDAGEWSDSAIYGFCVEG